MPTWASAAKVRLAIIFLGAFISANAGADDQHWLRVSSDHFLVLTDADAKKGHEIVARFEQMRAIFAQLLGRKKLVMAKPLEIIAIGNPAAYAQIAPTASTDLGISQGFFLRGDDRIYIVLNASVPDCWRAGRDLRQGN